MVRKTRRNLKRTGGSPKAKTEKNEPSSPEKCPICLESMTTNTVKTACKHKFHKKCLMKVCDFGRNTCPLCRTKITKDCVKLQPGKFMPDNRIENIVRNEKRGQTRVIVDDDVAEKILERMKKMLQLLKYPKKFDTSDWNKLNYFSEACNASTNLQKIRPLLTPERADVLASHL